MINENIQNKIDKRQAKLEWRRVIDEMKNSKTKIKRHKGKVFWGGGDVHEPDRIIGKKYK